MIEEDPTGDEPFKNYSENSLRDAYVEVYRYEPYRKLLTDENHKTAKNLLEIASSDCLLFVIRLYGRVTTLFRQQTLLESIKITEDIIEEALKLELISSDTANTSTHDLLCLLQRKEIEILCKQYKVNNKLKMDAIRLELIRLTTRKSFFSNSSIEQKLRKSILDLIHKVYAVPDIVVDTINKIIILFTLTSERIDAGNVFSLTTILKSELYNISRTRYGEMIYPTYKILRKSSIIESPDALDDYINLKKKSLSLSGLVFNKKFDEIYMQLSEDMEENYIGYIRNDKNYRVDLPIFLRKFTLMNSKVRIILRYIETCEKLKKFEEAVETIERLLLLKSNEPNVFIIESILGSKKLGKILDRYMVNCRHIKDQERSLKFIDKINPKLKSGLSISLQQQIVKMKSNANCSKKRRILFDQTINDENELIISAKEVTVQAKVVASSTDFGSARPMYLWEDSEKDSKELLYVEDWCINYFKDKDGFIIGYHCETSILLLLFVIFSYDLIFDNSLEDRFISLRQTCPLDFFVDDLFFQERRGKFEQLFTEIEENFEAISLRAKKTYSDLYGTRIVYVSWDILKDEEEFFNLITCLGKKTICQIVSTIAKNPKSWSSGGPDLLLCNFQENRCRFIEVKGPTDKLSYQQIAWIDILHRAEADIIVCHVEASSNKRLKIKDE